MERKFKLSNNRMLAGVCGGMGEYFNVDPTIVRIIVAIATLCTGFVFGAIAYAVAYFISKNN